MKIEITNLKKVIKGATVLDDINYTFTGGRIYGLCGKNGCGKTMLMRLMARPDLSKFRNYTDQR